MEGAPKQNLPERKPIFKKIDLSKAETWNGSREGYKDYIVDQLKKSGVYSPDILYRGFDVERVGMVKKDGTDIPESEMIWCSKEGELLNGIDGESALTYALEGNGLSIYNPEKLDLVDDMHCYKPKEGLSFKDALLGSFNLAEGN